MRRSVPIVLTAVLMGLVTAPTPVMASVPSGFVVSGSGFGHGVGLPQYGAANQARDGASAEQIISYYYTGAAVMPTTDTRSIRVNLLEDVATVRLRARQVDSTPMSPTDDPLAAVEVQVDDTVVLGDPADTWSFSSPEPGVVAVTRTSGDTSTIVASGESVSVRWSGTGQSGQTGDAPAYLNIGGPGQSLGGTTRRYRYGWVQIVPAVEDSAPVLHVVNVLRVHDEYLYGLAEVPSSWPREALRAQAIAARSYAVASMRSVRSVCACHVRSTTADQVFAGWIKEVSAFGSAWRSAVDSTVTDTGGLVVMAGNTLVKAYFFSSSGGRTQHVEQVWTTPLAWLRSVDDPWSLREDNPYRTWRVTISQAAMAGAFRLPDVTSLSITARTAGEGIARIAATSRSGSTVSLSGETFRLRLGLRSTWVRSIVPSGTQVTPSPSPTSTEGPGQSEEPETPSPTPTGSPTPSGSPTPTASATARTTVTAPTLGIVGVPFTLSGTVTPVSAGMTVRRFLRVDSGFAPRGEAVAVASDGTWSMSVTADTPMALRYRIRIFTSAGVQVGQSSVFDVEVRQRAPQLTMTTSPQVVVGETFTISGTAVDVPANSAAQRQVLTEVGWADRGEPVPVTTDGVWAMDVTAPSTAQRMAFRVVLIRAGAVLTTSPEVSVDFVPPPPRVTMQAPTQVRVTRAFRLRGEVTGVTGQVTVQRQVKVGRVWVNRGEPIMLSGPGTWVMRVIAPGTPQTMTFRILVQRGTVLVVRSTPTPVTFIR